MWLLRLLVSFHENFAYWLLGLLIIEGLFGLAMMFIFPPMSLAMVFLGLITLAIALVLKPIIRSGIVLLARILGTSPPPLAGPGSAGP